VKSFLISKDGCKNRRGVSVTIPVSGTFFHKLILVKYWLLHNAKADNNYVVVFVAGAVKTNDLVAEAFRKPPVCGACRGSIVNRDIGSNLITTCRIGLTIYNIRH
jgi:hypothetical protein